MPVEKCPTLPYARESSPRWTRRQIIKMSIGAAVLACSIHGLRALDHWATRPHWTRRDSATADLNCISVALDSYRDDVGCYPSDSEGLKALITNCSKTPHWNGPYLKRLRPDPWGSAYQYRVHQYAKGADFIIRSAGPDHLFGNADDVICRSSDADGE